MILLIRLVEGSERCHQSHCLRCIYNTHGYAPFSHRIRIMKILNLACFHKCIDAEKVQDIVDIENALA